MNYSLPLKTRDDAINYGMADGRCGRAFISISALPGDFGQASYFDELTMAIMPTLISAC